MQPIQFLVEWAWLQVCSCGLHGDSAVLRLVQTIERVLWHSRCGRHEHFVWEFDKKCLWHKLPPRLGRTSILQQGMPLCSSWKPTIFGSFRGNTALPRNIFIACSQHVCWVSTLANIMFLAATSGCAAEYVPWSVPFFTKTCLWSPYENEHASSKMVECGLKGVTMATHFTRYWVATVGWPSNVNKEPKACPAEESDSDKQCVPFFVREFCLIFSSNFFVGVPENHFAQSAISPNSLELETLNQAHSTGIWIGYTTVSRVFH